MSDTAYAAVVLAKEIPKQSVEVSPWFFLAAYSKMQKQRNKLMKEFLKEKWTE